jgi:TPR repeat protein
MNEKDNFALVPRPPSAIEKTAPGAKRILSGMVADTLALTKRALRLRIIVVNDEEGPIQSIKIILQKWYNKDAEVLAFDDSEKAWQELLRTDPDLLITDDIMPALGGMEIVSRLADKKTAYPVILTTSFERTELLMCVRDCASRGLNIKLLNAPWDLESFLKAVEDSLKIPRAIVRSDAETPSVVADADLDALVRKGKQLYNSDEWTEENLQAIELFLRAAEAGHSEAQFLVFKCSQHWQSILASVGECGLQIDKTAPIEWLRKSAESGFAEAQCILGLHYDTGQDVIQDAIEAAMWYRKAAEQGSAMAQRYLATCYENGNGVPQNYAEAVKWYRKAAEQEDAAAQCWLGMSYATGDGVSQDAVEAYLWVKFAEAQGYEDAAKAMDLIEALLTPDQHREAENHYNEFKTTRKRPLRK